jgi:cation diffusion facilitator CzcD-associated flavoprotein CzcO
MQPEIQTYFNDVAKKYDIERRVRFNSVVESARWDESSGTWEVTIRDMTTAEILIRRSKVLISAVGALSVPKECDTPGASDFEGRMFHTAKWDHSLNWKDKEVVIIGELITAST